MVVKTEGFDALQRKLQVLPEHVATKFRVANRQNGEDLVRLARVLMPMRTGTARRLIKGAPSGDTAYLVDFGPVARLLEGGTGERFTKTGARRGRGPKIPVVAPSLKATLARRRRRNRKALRDAIKAAG